MRFIWADALDLVDPNYDFVRDRNGAGRTPYWDDYYPHELMGYAPYDGILVSRGIVGGPKIKGKYTDSQSSRFRRVGARRFLRLDGPKLKHLPIFGDCGAFTYHKEYIPPYTPDETAEFYDDCGFTHGCSVDHIIFDFDDSVVGMAGGQDDARRRFEITLENAAAFLSASRQMTSPFQPLGVIQGWSPGSMAESARRLVAMGYDYLALGGTVPLKSPQIKACLTAIREAIPQSTRLHILGFAKANEIDTFASYNITSFDTTSPLIRAFKDAKANYYIPNNKGGISYYTAIRVPQAIENTKLVRLAKRGDLSQERLLGLERQALTALRAFDRDECGIEETLNAVMDYAVPAEFGASMEQLPVSGSIESLRQRYSVTLGDRPWRRCGCPICRSLGIEVTIFRATNRNKRRGFHNLGVFREHVSRHYPNDRSAHDDPRDA